MPKYTYLCEKCEEYSNITHSMACEDVFLCPTCDQQLEKVPGMPLDLKIVNKNAKIGDVVKSSIKDFKEDLKTQRKEASERDVT